MTVFLTNHSIERFSQRGVEKWMVNMAIANPDEEGKTRGKNFVIKQIRGKILKVIFEKKNKHEIIITAYFL